MPKGTEIMSAVITDTDRAEVASSSRRDIQSHG